MSVSSTTALGVCARVESGRGISAGKPRKALRNAALVYAVQAVDLGLVEKLEARVLLTAAHTFNFNSSLNDFAAQGNVSIEDSSFYTPVQGGQTAQVLISNGAAFNGGSTPLSVAALETSLGLAAGSLTAQSFGTATDGSAIMSPGAFPASAGQVVTFSADFLTSEPSGGQNDFAFALLKGPNGTTITPLGNAQSGNLNATSLSNKLTSNFLSETGSQAQSLTIPSTGMYSIGFGVVNVGDEAGASGLLINGVGIPSAIGSFDMGTASSPVASNYAQVTPNTVYNVDQGFGWLSSSPNPVNNFDTAVITSFGAIDPNVTRDNNYTTGATFADNVPNGYYDVTLTLGDARGYGYTNNVYFQNSSTATDQILTGASNAAVITKTYKVGVSNGQLDVGIGSAPGQYAVIDGLNVVADATPFAIASSTPASGGTVTNSFNTVTLNFSRPVDLTTAQTLTNYTLTLPNSSTATPTSAVVNGSMVTLTFANQAAGGAYTLSFGGVHDIGGLTLAGPTSISFTNNVTGVPTKYDFGTAGSPVSSGYTGIAANAYNSALGYGWLPAATVGTLDTGYTTNSLGLDPALVRDFNYISNGTFAVNEPNGLYDVTLTLGDLRGFGYPQTISFGGVQADTLTTGGTANPAVISKTYVVGVTNGQLQVGIGAAAGGSYGVIDALSFIPDNTAFALSASTPANNSIAYGPTSTITLNFSHPLGASALVASNYQLTSPGGQTITSVSALGANSVVLNLTPPTTVGAYTLTIGTGIQDTAGNSLGAPVTINFSQTVVTAGKYDFGTATSAVAAGYTQVTPTSAFTSLNGYGWLSGGGPISAFDTTFIGYTTPDPAVTRDFDYSTSATFAANVGNGLYDVTLTLGDARGYTYPQTVSFGGVQADSLTTGGGANPAVVTKTYVVGVTNGQLTVNVAAATGGSYAVIDGLSFSQDSSAFNIAGSSPTAGSTFYGPVSSVGVTFSHPVGSTALVAANYSVAGPGNLTVTGVTALGANGVTLMLSGPTTVGAYTIGVSSSVQDTIGNALAPASSISFTQSQLTAGSFDFGSATSPVATGYTQITPANALNITNGYGWLPGANPISSYDTQITSLANPSLSRDYNYTLGGTFGANVANGLYDVTLVLGDARGYGYTQTVSFNGTQYDTVTTNSSNAVVTKTYVVGVTNGQLDLGLAGVGGAYAVIDGMTFTPDTSAFTISSSTPAASSTVYGPIGTASITFSHPLGAGALTASNYSLAGPGNLTISTVTQTSATSVSLTLSGVTSVGSYTLSVGSGVLDAAGAAISGTTAISFAEGVLVSGKYQFGPGTEPLASGWTEVTPTTSYSVSQGYGFVTGGPALGALDTHITTFTNPDPNVTRALVYGTSVTFDASVPNGLYDVTLVLGDPRQYSYPQTVSFNGQLTDTPSTGGSNGAILVKTYVVGVTNGVMNVNVGAGAGGSFAVLDGLSFVPDGSPFTVTASSPAPSSTAYGNLTTMAVNYNHPVGVGALNAANYVLTDTTGVTVSSVTQNGPNGVTLAFSGPATAGSYTLAIQTGSSDVGGNTLTAIDAIPFTTALNTYEKFSFEPASSPTTAGYTPVYGPTLYTDVAGYGWATNNVSTLDTGVVNHSGDPNLNREFAYTASDSFNVYLANGTYNVAVALGDVRGYSYTMGINFQSGLGPQDTVSTGGSSNTAIVNKTYVVTVTNGLLTLGLTGATNSYAVLSGMVITPTM